MSFFQHGRAFPPLTTNKQTNEKKKPLQASHKTIQVQLNPIVCTGCEFKKDSEGTSFFFKSEIVLLFISKSFREMLSDEPSLLLSVFFFF